MEGKKYTLQLKNQILALTKAESALWVKAVEPVINSYIAEAKKKGIDGKKAVAELKKLIAGFNK